MNDVNQACPCGSGRSFDQCCGAWIEGDAYPPRAEQLMRSRYCAFVLGNSNYLLQTWHADTRPAQLVLSPDVSWFGLEIVAIEAGEAQDSEGRVEFMAKFNGHDRLQYLHERSRFVREDGRWFYVDGESVPQAKAPKIGRNEPCPCGSGKKYKRCCG